MRTTFKIMLVKLVSVGHWVYTFPVSSYSRVFYPLSLSQIVAVKGAVIIINTVYFNENNLDNTPIDITLNF
jgi:hypothetical protein